MSSFRIQQKNPGEQWVCDCSDPACARREMHQLCQRLRRDIPRVTEDQLRAIVAGTAWDTFDQFMIYGVRSHWLPNVMAGTDALGESAFGLEYEPSPGIWSVLLMSPRTPEDALPQFGGAAWTIN